MTDHLEIASRYCLVLHQALEAQRKIANNPPPARAIQHHCTKNEARQYLKDILKRVDATPDSELPELK